MSIATRIEAIEEHIGDIYDTLTLGGADLTGVNKNLVNVTNQLKDRYLDFMNNGTWGIWNNCEKVTGEGTSLSLSPTIQAPMKNILKGNTSQSGTPTPSSPIPVNVVSGDNEIVVCGKNLFDKSKITENKRLDGSGSLINDNSYDTSDFFVVKASTTYSFTTFGGSDCVCEYNHNKEFIKRTMYNAQHKLTTDENTYYVRVAFEKIKLNTYQFEIGDTNTTYEAFTSNTYNVDLPVENLLDNTLLPTSWNNTSVTTISLNVKPNTKYTMSCNVPFYNTFANIFFYDESGTGSTDTNGVTIDKSVTVTSSANGIVKVGYRSYSGSSLTRDDYWYMVEEGEKANSYTPYGTTPIEMCSSPDGTIRDGFLHDKVTGKWYKYGMIGKVVLNGSEEGYSMPSTNRFNIDNLISYIRWSGDKNYLSNYYTPYAQTTNNADFNSLVSNVNNGFNLSSSASNFTIRFKDTRFTSISDFQTWLASNNVSVYYTLLTPTTTEITYTPLIEQLNAIEQATSKENQTNISQVNNDLPFIINSTMLKEV